jgi:MFS family permease
VFVLTYATGQAGMEQQTILTGVMIGAALELFAIPFFGALSDRVGRRPVYLFGAVVTALFAYPMFWLIDTGTPALAWLALVVMFVFSHAAMYGPQAAFLSEMFGTRVRYSGASLGAQMAGVLAGGTSPLIATALLIAGYGRGALSLYIIAMALVTIVAVLLASETHRDDIS